MTAARHDRRKENCADAVRARTAEDMLMYEMMVAQSLLTIISDEAAKHNAKPVGAKISCGTLNPVNDEALRFAFDAIAKDTLCEGLEFQIEYKPIQARCENCGPEFDVEF